MNDEVLGAQLYTVRQFTKTISDIDTTLKKISDIGYTSIQISGFGQVDMKKVAKYVKEYGLTVAGTHVDWKRFQADIEGVISEQKTLGCTHAAIGGLPSEYFSLDGLTKFTHELLPISERLKQDGIDFSYHNHSHELRKFGKKTWLQMLYERTRPEVLKAEIDVYWIQAGGGDPSDWIRKVSNRIPLLHLKDMTVGPNREQRMAEIGEGNMNWLEILRSAKESNVEWYLVEQDNCYERDPFESLGISYKNLRNMGIK